jgi:hypothetical protein
MGVAGDLTRGAFWWAGGEDRINIDCETGKVKIKNALETPALKADIIQGLSTTTLRIEDNVVITGNLTLQGDTVGPLIMVDTIKASTADHLTIDESVLIGGGLTVIGTIEAENSNPFWVAGRFTGGSLSKLDSAGRSDYNVDRVAGFPVGVYRISFNSHAKGRSYITNATGSAVQCGVMNDPGYIPTATEVIIFARANTGALVDCEMNFIILA